MVAPIRFLSGRQQQQKIGVEGSTENKKVLEVVGRVGIGSTIFEPDVTLDIRGDANISGNTNIGGSLTIGSTTGGAGLSAESLTISGLSSTKDLYVSGFSTFKNVVDIDSNTYISGKLGIGTDVAPIGKFEVAGGESNFRGNVNIYDDLFVAGNVSVAGSSVTLDTETVRVEDKDIVLGFTTTITPNDVTANHGGIAIASTEGYPLVPLYAVGINTLPDTYKQFMWVKSGTYAGMTTDAWISNYPISIGNTSIEEGVTLKVGTGATEIRMYGNTGIISAYRYFGSGGFLDDIIKEKLEGITAVLVDSVGTATTLGEERKVADLFIDNSNASVGYITAVGFGSTAIYYFNDVTAIGLTTDANINTSGIITAFGFEANGGTFTGDGSGLTGLAGVAAGVTVADNDTDVGTASRLNFGPDIDVSAISSGIVTMSLNANQNFTGIVTVSTLDVTNLDADNATIGLATVSELTGINTLGIGTVFDIKSSPSDNGSLIFEASAGEILTLTNNLTEGSLFSISDEFGVPTFDSNADGTVSIVPYNVGHYLGIGKTNPQAKLDVSGDALFDGYVAIGTNTPFTANNTTNSKVTIDVGVGTDDIGLSVVSGFTTTYDGFQSGGRETIYRGLNITNNVASDYNTAVIQLNAINSSGYNNPWYLGAISTPESGRGGQFFIGHRDNAAPNGRAELLRIGTDGEVGIGTTNPSQRLDVNGNARLRGALYDFNNATGNPGELLTTTGVGVSWTTSTTTPSGRSVTNIASSTPYYITASETTSGVSTAAYVDPNIVIKDSNLGIGTDNPQAKFHVRGSSSPRIENTGTISLIRFQNSSYENVFFGSDIDNAVIYTQSTEKLRITNSGNVGIGLTNPSQTLDVNGNARFRENVSIGTDTSDARLTVDVGTGLTAFIVDGSEGQLFSVTNNLTSGSIFSVNDVTGVPSIDVNADGRVLLTPYGSNEYVGVGLTNPQAKLDVNGNALINGVTVGAGGGDLSSNAVLGSIALASNTTGASNVAIGREALNTNSTGNNNVAVGRNAGRFVTGDNSTLVGYSAGANLTSGEKNIFLGFGAGAQVTTGSNNTIIGDNDGSASLSDTVIIAAGINERLRIDSSGNAGIGTTNPQAKLHVDGDALVTAKLDVNGGVVVSGVVTATDFNSTSDARLKTNVQVIEDPLEKVLQINGVSFNWIKDNRPSMGVIADNVQEVLPELVSDTDPKTVNYNGLIGLLIECVKQQQVEIEELKRKIG